MKVYTIAVTVNLEIEATTVSDAEKKAITMIEEFIEDNDLEGTIESVDS